eukprot:CAMPEP_0117442280 /NCGR_PEP_ID=MMETSP0759-20121206/4069_1 /TAXON_ID=63605 /ORGANISM="Percolomonas cosmopolitus, Strain WS" /LENGTH=304 /DNA_ID=CAMNT_0005234161 /DNA_START=187 /DNA_END=1101 /DNA_ORIENTATION=+
MSSLLLAIFVCVAVLFSHVYSRNTDVEVKYVNYLLQEINSWMVHENERRLANFTQAVTTSADAERQYLESRLGKDAFAKFLKIYEEAKRGPEMRKMQQDVFLNIISGVENILNFKYSVANNGASYHHPALSCSVVKKYFSDFKGEGDSYWINPVQSDHSFQQYCDLKNGGWGLFAQIGSKVSRDKVSFGDANINDVNLRSPKKAQDQEVSQFRSDRFLGYGANWILRVDSDKKSVYFAPKDNSQECNFSNVKQICGGCACKTFVSESGPVKVEDIKFTDEPQTLIPDDESLTYYVYTAPAPIKE